VFLAYIAVAALLWQAPESSSSVSLKDNEIWLQTPSGERQLTHDGVPKRLPTLSPAGDGLIYVVDHLFANHAPEEEIVILDRDGSVHKRITPQGVWREFDRLDWLDDHRIGALECGHMLCQYLVMDPGSGKTTEIIGGGFLFTWSHDRQFVAIWDARWCDGSQGEPCYEHDSVTINRDEVYPLEKTNDQFDDPHSHDIGLGAATFVWSPDDKWVAFTDLIGPQDDWYVVIVSPNGKMLRDTVPIDPDYKATLEWLDDTHLDLHAGKRVFHFALADAQFSEVRGASTELKHP